VRGQFPRHIIRRTERDVCRNAKLLQEPSASFDEAWSAVETIHLEPKTVQGDKFPTTAGSGDQDT
jgi:hypothetical protein